MKTRLSIIAGAATLAVSLAIVGTANAATLLSDNFADGNADGWTKSGGSWSVVSGEYRQTGTGADAKAQAGSTSWTTQSVSAKVRPLAFGNSTRSVGVQARAQSMTNFYSLVLIQSGSVQLRRTAGGGTTTLATAATSVTIGTTYTLTLTANGSALSGSVNGAQLVSANDSALATGRAGLITSYAAAAFDDVVVTDTPGTGPTGSPTASPTSSPTASPTSSPPPDGTCNTSGTPTGFAAVNAWGQNGTTGGAGGPKIEVDTAAELLSAIAQTGPVQICVKGMLTLPAGMHNVTSNKSIIGVGAGSGITGAGFNIGIPIDDAILSPPANAVRNIIIRNMVFRNANDDSINVQMFSHHIWLDHNDLAQGYDGLIDVKRGSSYVTISWNHTHHHSKNMLLGRDDADDEQDTGRLKVSYHHNWFNETPQRNPRVRYGEPVHIYNNYYFHNTDVGVACQTNAGCMVEGNYFENVEEPITNSYAGPSGRCVARNNIYTGTEPGQPDCSGSVEEPSNYYSYTLDNPGDVKAIVMAGAGTGKI